MAEGDIRWRLHLRSPPEQVFRFWATDAGRSAFLSEASEQAGGEVRLRYPNGQSLTLGSIVAEPPHRFVFSYFGGSGVEVLLEPDGRGGCDLTLVETGASEPEENRPGWVSVLLALKAACDHGVDLRNHDPARTWDEGYVDN